MVAAALLCVCAKVRAANVPVTLKEAFKDHFRVGTAVNGSIVTGDAFRRTPAQVGQDRNSQIAHEQLLEKARKGGIDVYFLGDSITRRWRATDYPEFLANWNTSFFGWNAAGPTPV